MPTMRITRPRRTFAGLLGTLIVALVFQLSVPDTELTRLITIVLQGAVVLAALNAAGASSRVMIGALLAVAVLLGLALLVTIGPGDIGPAIPRACSLALVLVAPAAVVVGLRRELQAHGRVTLKMVYGGLSLYLLIGLAFAFVFALVQNLSGDPFFAGGSAEGTPNDYLYFSLSTLTTTGYGDLAAGTSLGRAFAVSEALIGQIYLVTVVAALVSNVGQARRSDRLIE